METRTHNGNANSYLIYGERYNCAILEPTDDSVFSRTVPSERQDRNGVREHVKQTAVRRVPDTGLAIQSSGGKVSRVSTESKRRDAGRVATSEAPGLQISEHHILKLGGTVGTRRTSRVRWYGEIDADRDIGRPFYRWSSMDGGRETMRDRKVSKTLEI